MTQSKLLSPYNLSGLELTNRVVMAPMTRTRAEGPDDLPTEMMARYYAQRASAGLIISEATHISPEAVGYQYAPGIFSNEQVDRWKLVTSAVHQSGGKIFIQLFHTGRLSHPYFQRGGKSPLSASAVPAKNCVAYINNYHGETIQVPFGDPVAMTLAQVHEVIHQFSIGALNAVRAGFDGVEIHAANGYLLEQFMNPKVNVREDQYGGTIENRIRIVLDIVDAVSGAIGAERTAVRISPFGTLHDMAPYAETEELMLKLVNELNRRSIAYLHVFDQGAFGTATIPNGFQQKVRKAFDNTLMLCGGFDHRRAEEAIRNNEADLVAFGRPFIGNPDFVQRLERNLPLANSDATRWYGTSGAEGYIDYPCFEEVNLSTTK